MVANWIVDLVDGYRIVIAKALVSALIVMLIALLRRFLDKFIVRMVRRFSASKHGGAIGIYFTEQYVKPVRHFITLIFIIVGILILVGIWGLSDVFGSVLVGAGVAAVVVGFAAQGVLSDFIAGVMILFDNPFSIGEWITVGDIDGIVTDISLRSTRIRSFNGEYVTIPNRKIAQEVVVNKTRRRNLLLTVTIGVDYEADLDKAMEVTGRVLQSQQEVIEEPPPEVVVTELAASSVKLQLRFWTRGLELPDALRLKSTVIKESKKRLEEAGMSIPFQHIELIQHN